MGFITMKKSVDLGPNMFGRIVPFASDRHANRRAGWKITTSSFMVVFSIGKCGFSEGVTVNDWLVAFW